MTERSSILAENPEDAVALVREHATRGDLVAWDTETTGLQVRNGTDYARIVQFSWRPWKVAVVLPATKPYFRIIKRIFEDAAEMVGHNVKFDVHAMANVGVNVLDHFEPNQVHDTMWTARLYDERTSAKLKDLATRYVREDASESQAALKRKMKANGWSWKNVPVKYLVEYGGNDAIITGELFDYLYPQIGYAAEAYLREQKLHPVLYRMERTGLYVDRDLFGRTTAEYEQLYAETRNQIDTLAPNMSANSPVQIKAEFRKRGIELPNTQAQTLSQMDDDLARAIVNFRQVHKLLNTYLKPWDKLIAPTGRLHPWFNQLGTATGRFSSSDPNLQNIPRGHAIRDLFGSPEGNKIIVADWNQMELRMYAHFAEDENMRAAFLSGDDIYQQAADLLGVPRQVGKMIMLASIYGAGPRTLKKQCITMSSNDPEMVALLESYDWEELYERFHGRYKIKALARQCELAARRRSMIDEAYIRTWGGRRQRPKLVLSRKTVNGRRQEITIYKDLANSLVQGSSADMMKQALVDVDKQGLGEALRLTVHDEMVLEIPEADVEEAKVVIEKVMTHREFIPPLTINVEAADRYGDAK
jgi:DNA polymerase-1